MNERQKKIMVPYQEPTTDTCPDCSEHPCDCGIPAGYQSDIRFAANFAPHIKVMEASKVAEIIQQRDELLRYNEAFRQDALICADCDAISKKEYDQAIEQWDRLAEALRKAISWGDSASHHILHRQNINWTYLNEAREALAAVKGGSNES